MPHTFGYVTHTDIHIRRYGCRYTLPLRYAVIIFIPHTIMATGHTSLAGYRYHCHRRQHRHAAAATPHACYHHCFPRRQLPPPRVLAPPAANSELPHINVNTIVIEWLEAALPAVDTCYRLRCWRALQDGRRCCYAAIDTYATLRDMSG